MGVVCGGMLVEITFPTEVNATLQALKQLHAGVCDCMHVAVALPYEAFAAVETLVTLHARVDQNVFV